MRRPWLAVRSEVKIMNKEAVELNEFADVTVTKSALIEVLPQK